MFLITKDFLPIAFALQMNIFYRFNTESKIAGHDWARKFLQRHLELFIVKPEATNVAGVVGFNKINVDKS